VDANGKLVGRFYPSILPGNGTNHEVMLQIQGNWVALPINDFTVGFTVANPVYAVVTYFQSADCSGQPFMYVNQRVLGNNAPAIGVVTAIPPATAPSVYFPVMPSVVTTNSYTTYGEPCDNTGGLTAYMGAVQSVPVSSLGLTLPFSIK
jgi:hypothetical protein